MRQIELDGDKKNLERVAIPSVHHYEAELLYDRDLKLTDPEVNLIKPLLFSSNLQHLGFFLFLLLD